MVGMSSIINSPNIKITQILEFFLVSSVLFVLTGCATANPDLNAIMTRLSENLHTIVIFINALSYVMGLWFMYSGLYSLKIYGDLRTMMPSNASMAGPLLKLILGVMLLLMPGMVKISISSLWGAGAADSLMQYPTLSPSMQSWENTIKGVIDIIRVLGYISFLRGFNMLSKATKQQAQPGLYGKGTMHVLGGVLAINIVGTINIIQYSLGFAIV